MRSERGLQIQESQEKEVTGHDIEDKVVEFLAGSFDCIASIEKTNRSGANDKKGIDAVLTFKDGDKMAVDVTAGVGQRVDDKRKSMTRNPLVKVEAERNEQGRVVVEKSKDLVPRGIIQVDMAHWQEYGVESVNGEVMVYMPDEKTRIREEKDVLHQLLRQIDHFSSINHEYETKTEVIKNALIAELKELQNIEQEL